MRGRRADRSSYIGLVLALAGVTLLAACARPPEVDLPASATEPPQRTPTNAASATPEPPDTVIVCLAQEPTSLYIYGNTNRATDVVLAALYDGPVDLVDYQYQAAILEQLPSLENGDAVVEPISIGSGDVYLNPETLAPDTLRRGKPYTPSGCRERDCILSYDGGAVEIDRMRVTFRLNSGLLWSDGEPLQASDSVFSYELDGHPDTFSPKFLYARTFSYTALDENTVEWIGLPGFLDAEYPSNFWSPLPEHQLGDLAPADLSGSEAATRTPLGWGPYRLLEWREGAEIRLERNPSYDADADPPAFEQLVFRFVEPGASALEQLQTGECDVLNEDLLPAAEVPSLRSRAQAGGYQLSGAAGPTVERLDFNLQPLEGERFFADVRTRRGLAACLDRAEIAAAIAGEYAATPAAFLPVEHPLYSSSEAVPSYDPDAGRALLEEAGWVESESGPRSASGADGVSDGTSLSFELLVQQGEIPEQVGGMVAQAWRDCGADVTVRALPGAELFASWPEGPVFGRGFAAVIWAWPVFGSPPCEMLAGWEIPGEEHPLGVNASGYQQAEYDAACGSLLLSPPDATAFSEAAQNLQARLVQDVPTVPLYQRPRLIAYSPWLCGVEIDASATTALWNVEQWHPCPHGREG